MFAHRLLTLFFLTLASPLVAADVVLIVTGDEALPGALGHDNLTQRFRDAGYEVYAGEDLNRADMTKLIAQVEGKLADTGRLVIHLSGPVAAEAGLSVYLPRDVSPESRTEVLTGGVPLALLLEMAATRPGQSMLALGLPRLADPLNLNLDIPQGVLVLRGRPPEVRDVVVDQMLRAGRTVPQIDAAAAGVQFDGLITDFFRLAEPPDPAASDADPTAVEAQLSEADRVQIQTDLADLGYGPGDVDGVFGSATRGAIRAWQRDNGQPADGVLSSAQIRDLADAATAERAARAAASSAEQAEREAWDLARTTDTLRAYRDFLVAYPEGRFTARAQDRVDTLEAASETAQRIRGYRQQEQNLGLTVASVAVIERRLDALGLAAGPPDGRVDRQTRRAIATFQAQRGLTPTGYLDPATIQRLILAGAEAQ